MRRIKTLLQLEQEKMRLQLRQQEQEKSIRRTWEALTFSLVGKTIWQRLLKYMVDHTIFNRTMLKK